MDGTTVIPKPTRCRHGLIATVEESYNRHIALELSAEDFWIAISQAVSLFLSDKTNAEKYRERFVNHKGQKKLEVENDDSAKGWTWFVDKITEMIKGNMNSEFVELMTTSFSSTTPLESTIFKISLMEAAQHYFSYRSNVLCGIPEVCIKGTISDFEDIKRRLSAVGDLLEDLKWWTNNITVTMDKIIQTMKGNQDLDWWKSIITERWETSGEPARMDGWICEFIPFTKIQDGTLVVNRERGIIWEALNPGLTYTPVTKKNLLTREKKALRLCGGFLGIAANYNTKRLKPSKGWMIFREQ